MLLFLHTTLLPLVLYLHLNLALPLLKSTMSSSVREVSFGAVLCCVLACPIHFAIPCKVWHHKSVMIHVLM